MNSSFGSMLKELRREAGFTQAELGKEVHLHGSALSRYERGVIPDRTTLVAIINALASSDKVDRKQLDRLWEATNLVQSEAFETPVSDRLVERIHYQFEKYDEEERKILRKDINTILALNQDFASARKYRKQKQWEEATERLRSLRAQMDMRFQDWYLRVDEALGDCYYSGISFSEAIWHYELALMSAQQLKDKHKQGELLIKTGNVYRRRGGNDSKRALEYYYAQAMKIFIELGDREWEAGCYRKIGGAWLFLGRPDEAEKLLDQSLAICVAEECGTGLYKGMQHKAWACSMLGRWDEAVHLCRQALKLTPESNNWDRIKGLRYLGDALRIARQRDEAEKTYQKALDLVERLGVQKSRTVGLICLGMAKLHLNVDGRERDAKAYLEEGLKYHVSLGEDFRAIDFTVEQGYLLFKLGRLEEAETRLSLAERRYSEQGNQYYHARILALLSELYYRKESDNKVTKLKEILEKAQGLDNGMINYFLGQIYFIYGKTLLDDQRYDEAAEAWYSAVKKLQTYPPVCVAEISTKIASEIDRISRAMSTQPAIQMGEAYLKTWESEAKQDRENEVIQTGLEKVKSKIHDLQSQTPFN